ncbi:MAG: outer membrane beta-barrel protein [Alistipes sp.]|nr:outer membrane beta-barrel protein [Alistipes sp.]
MKRLLLISSFVLLFASGTASARRLQVGFRGGINTTDYRFSPVAIGETRFVTGSSRAGFETGFVLRLNLSKFVHLQSELNYDFVNYSIRATRANLQTDVRLRSERLEVPVQLGFQLGIVRLFGGASFRLNNSLHSSHPDLLKIRFDTENMAWMGGIGLNFKHFFLDFRLQGYPGSKHNNIFESNGIRQKVHIRSNIVYGGSLGFFF